MDLSTAVEQYMAQEGLYCLEGRRGVKALCKISRAVGYTDPQHFGQLGHDCCVGDLIAFLEDNSGAIAAIIEWIGNTESPEMLESLGELVVIEDGDEDQ